jgi:hypothetical protein
VWDLASLPSRPDWETAASKFPACLVEVFCVRIRSAVFHDANVPYSLRRFDRCGDPDANASSFQPFSPAHCPRRWQPIHQFHGPRFAKGARVPCTSLLHHPPFSSSPAIPESPPASKWHRHCSAALPKPLRYLVLGKIPRYQPRATIALKPRWRLLVLRRAVCP